MCHCICISGSISYLVASRYVQPFALAFSCGGRIVFVFCLHRLSSPLLVLCSYSHLKRGEEAVNANNVFFHLTYEGAVDIDSITEPLLKEAVVDQIAQFGVFMFLCIPMCVCRCCKRC